VRSIAPCSPKEARQPNLGLTSNNVSLVTITAPSTEAANLHEIRDDSWVETQAKIWTHELGHQVHLPDIKARKYSNSRLMYESVCGHCQTLDQEERDAYKWPPIVGETTEPLIIRNHWVKIDYASPPVAGRAGGLFGPAGRISQYPNFPFWRAGANNFGPVQNDLSFFTLLRTQATLDFDNGTKVPPGDYGLFVKLDDAGKWELVISRKSSYDAPDYDAPKDLCRIAMTLKSNSKLVENLKYSLSPLGRNRGRLELSWEYKQASVSFTARD
jgi:hypothetical protein